MNAEEQEERAFVIKRDGECVLHKRDPEHVCRSPWGDAHAPTRTDLLTVEHVKDHLMMGRRAASDRRHMVAMCWGGNVGVPSKEVRAWLRSYLLEVQKGPEHDKRRTIHGED